MRKKIILYLAAGLVLLNIYAWNEVFALAGPRYLEVNFLDIGQGDSEFIQTPQGHQILIDGGPDSGVVLKLQDLMPKYDRTLDLVILSHPEKDHMFGLLEVLKRYQVSYILWTGVVRDTPEYKEWERLLALSEKSGTRVVITGQGQEIKAGDIAIDNAVYSDEGNDASIVSRLIFGSNSFLFTGDISFAAEKEIMESGNISASDVLKVAHHGSKYSTSNEFLENVAPEIAVISVGKNSYGHPTPETLQRLNNFGIKVKRTDIDGDVEIVSDGNSIYMK